jgi:hypothetical protein
VAGAVLVDTGPLVAFLHRRDLDHQRCVTAWQTAGPFFTIWPVVTEAMHLLAFSRKAQDGLAELVERAVDVVPMDRADLPRIRTLMEKYADLPLDFADAGLVRIAERLRIGTIFTLDRDFTVVRPRHVRRFRTVP